MNPPELSDVLARCAQENLERFVARSAPGLRLPRVFAGHAVGPDVRADLVYTLGFLHGCGLGRIGDLPAEAAIARLLRDVDGAGTHTFYSYRVAETLARFGPFEGNPLLDGFSPDQRRQVALACDSTAAVALLDRDVLPRNYAAVLARCERARERLGLLDDPSLLGRMLERTGALLGRSPRGWLDDSRAESGRYDIYTADVYLFTEPLADRLGALWERGLANALDLVERVVDRRGAAITWGRSSGALATCLTIELAALAVARGVGAPGRWLALGERAARAFPAWLEDGLINAHRHRSPYAYRGPQRRLQMTLDALGKLAWAAETLRGVSGERAAARPSDAERSDPDRDEWIVFEDAPPAGVWSYRSRDLAFVLPIVGATASDYLPAPRNPTLFEVPVDAGPPTGTPVAWKDGRRFAAGHRPHSAQKRAGALEAVYDAWVEPGHLEVDGGTPRLAAERRVTWRVERRTLHAEEHWRFAADALPDALALQIAETRGRPLAVAFETDAPHAVAEIATDGLAELRSFWAELPRVHQIDLDPAPEVTLRWRVTPLLRVASTEIDHHYHRCLYDPLRGRVAERAFPRGAVAAPQRASALLEDLDLFHLHWPEWIAGPELAVHERLVRALRDADVRIVWTQHNLVPHRKDDRYDAIYRLWAREADAAIHHSEWGMGQVRARYDFGAHTLHRVIPHGHFGALMAEVASIDRAEAERELGLAPCRLRIGVVGAPRAEKRTDSLMQAFAACPRRETDDWQLLVLAADPDEPVPDDPRIRALPSENVERDVYNRRLATLDLLAIPIEGGDYLTTGQFADAIGLGLPVLASDWPFLEEMLGAAAIVYGRGAEAMRRTLDALAPERVARAAAASRALRERFDWRRIADRTLALFEEVGTAKL